MALAVGSTRDKRGWRRRGRIAEYWRRGHRIEVGFRPGEVRDLQAIADAWGVPVATVIWVVVHDWLARLRRQERQYGEAGLAIAGALRTGIFGGRKRRGRRPVPPVDGSGG